MRLNTYVHFDGRCEEAFRYYEQSLGGQIGLVFRYEGSPLASGVPADWNGKIMHGSITIGEHVLMGADVTPDRYEQPKGVSLSLHMKSAADADRMFNDLATGGQVVLALEKTFWAERFGMVIDRFGIPWLINCEGAGSPG